jgi:pimeloyl-ACP methyl ester carboxylesterase
LIVVAVTQRGFVKRPDCRLYYEVTGAGPAVVFIHGLGSNHLTWWQQVAHFAPRYTCVTFSHRGYAPSGEVSGGPDPKDFPGDLAALIERLELAEVSLVAQSMGGWSALEYAFAHPGRVRALVLASTAGTIERRADLLATPGQLTEWTRTAQRAQDDMRERGVHIATGERMAREQPALHFLYGSIAAVSAGVDREALRKRLAATAIRAPATLRDLSVPTLFITGSEDIVFPPFLADALAALMPNARVEQVAKAGHSVYFERAAEFNALVERFLGR